MYFIEKNRIINDTLYLQTLKGDKDCVIVADEASQGILFYSDAIRPLLEVLPEETEESMGAAIHKYIFAPIEKQVFSGPIFDCHATLKKLEDAQSYMTIS